MSEKYLYTIKTENLSKSFGNFKAVDNISLKVKKGEIFGFLGPNGSGKTTTIRMLCGILEPSSGKASVLDFDVLEEPENIKKRIGYMSQKFSLYPDLKVIENLEFFGGVYRVPEKTLKKKIKDAIEFSNLTKKENEMVKDLPIGHKQWLALSCAMLHDPELLFLDEPTSGVDPLSRKHFWEYIYELSESGKTIFVTTHYMEEAEHCNTLAFIHQGKILAQNSPDKIKEKEFDKKIYELECTEKEKAISLLNELPGIIEVLIFGDILRILCIPSVSKKQLQSYFKKQNIKIEKIQKAETSLEDVFVSLIS